MKSSLKILASVSTLALMLPVSAIGHDQGTFYGGVSASQLTVNVDGIRGDFKPAALIGRFGYFPARSLAIEARLGTGVGDDSVTGLDFGAPVRITGELDSLYGIYAVGHLRSGANDQVSLYGLAGFSRAKFTARASAFGESFSASDSDNGFSFGVGVEVKVSPQFSINGEWARYLDKSDYTVDGLSFGVNYLF
jgi:outer membrane immunogenic protein